MTTLFGPCIEGSVSLDERLIAAYAEIYGPNRCARLAIPWDKETNPSPGVFNLGMYVENCKKLKAAGFVVLLGNNWAPEHASEGVPTYVEYDNGSSFWTGNDPVRAATCSECGHAKYYGVDGPPTHYVGALDGTVCGMCSDNLPSDEYLNESPEHAYRPIGLRVMAFAKWRDCARNPRHIDGQSKYGWSEALAKQLGPFIAYASDMNEPGGWSYWPPMSLGQDIGLRRLFNESYIPWARAFALHAPHVKRIGIEAQGADEIWRLRELERESGLSVFPDGIAYHYPLNQEEAYENWGFNQPWKDERPRFVTEAGYDDLNLTLQELRQTMARPVKPKMFIWYQNIGQNITMVDPVTFKPNAFGEAIKAEIAKINDPLADIVAEREAGRKELMDHATYSPRKVMRVGHQILSGYGQLGSSSASLRTEIKWIKALMDSTAEFSGGVGSVPTPEDSARVREIREKLIPWLEERVSWSFDANATDQGAQLALMCLWLSGYRDSGVTAEKVMERVERIDARFKRPLLGEVKVLKDDPTF